MVWRGEVAEQPKGEPERPECLFNLFPPACPLPATAGPQSQPQAWPPHPYCQNLSWPRLVWVAQGQEDSPKSEESETLGDLKWTPGTSYTREKGHLTATAWGL
jgi:hypothetical protein